jgi:hypothetical protein
LEVNRSHQIQVELCCWKGFGEGRISKMAEVRENQQLRYAYMLVRMHG